VHVTHAAPERSNVQPCVCVVDVPEPHVPLEHVGVMQVRVCCPEESQLSEFVCVHALHAEHICVPHAVPSVLPVVHACIVIIAFGWHVPPPHVGLVVVTGCIPLVLHGMLGMHVPVTVPPVPHDMPSVFGRMHACISMVLDIAQVPLWHIEVVTVRVCMPFIAQAFAPKSQADQAPYAGEAHIVPSVLPRVQACISWVAVATQLPLVQW
jgi:hypothetical protein